MAIPVLTDTALRLTDCVYFGNPFFAGGVPVTRAVNTGFGLSGGGDLSVNRTIKVNDLVNGYNALNHGCVADGVTDNTAAYTAIFALADRGILVFPPGVFAGSLNLPDTGDTRDKNWSIVGAGIGETVLLPASANTPVIQKANRAGDIIQGATFCRFTVQAHPSGSTGPAIDLPGFRSCEFEDIGYSSNAGGDFASMFHLSAGQMRCYANTIKHVVIDGGTVPNTGPATVVLFDAKNDAGVPQGLNFTANNNFIEDFFVFHNTGINTGIDALRSDRTTVKNCFWEDNSGCTYVIAGTGGSYSGNNYESGVTTDTILFDSVVGEGASNNNIFVKERFSDMTALTFPSTVQDNTILDPELSVGCTFADLGVGNNIVILAGQVLQGTLQTLHAGSYGSGTSVVSTNLGTGGTATLLTGSNDTDGIISLNFGTTVPSFNGIVTLTFGTAYGTPPSAIVCPAAGPPSPGTIWSQPAAGNPQFQVGDIDTTQIQIRWVNGATPADNSVLRINYHIKGIPK